MLSIALWMCHIVHNIISVSYCLQHYGCTILSTHGGADSGLDDSETQNITGVLYYLQHYGCIILSTEPHMMVLILDLMTMKLRDLRRDIHLSARDYDKLMDRPVVSFSVSMMM